MCFFKIENKSWLHFDDVEFGYLSGWGWGWMADWGVGKAGPPWGRGRGMLPTKLELSYTFLILYTEESRKL